MSQEDFATLAGRTPQTPGAHFIHLANYLALFELMKQYLPAYQLERPKLFQVLVFDYLFSNGDAHFKNFSLLETPMGDFRLSLTYNLLNRRLHIHDSDFALEDGLLPKSMAQEKVTAQFWKLAEEAGIPRKIVDRIFDKMLNHRDQVEKLIMASFLTDKTKRNYLQTY